MKKIVSLILCVALLASACVLTGCTEKTLKFGSAVYVSGLAATDASADKNGAGDVCVTVAAITVDANGKIVACALDTMQTVVEYTVKGKAVGNPEFQTKYEKGDNYNMVAYGGAVQEWYKQADAFEDVVAGKTLDEVKALMDRAYKQCAEILTRDADKMKKIVEFLLKNETMTGQQFADCMAGKEIGEYQETTLFDSIQTEE